MHLQLEIAAGERADEDGIVEIARRFAVDGDDREIAEIAPGAQIVFGDLRRRGFRCRDDFFRKFVRQMMLANDDFDVDADVAGTAENFDHAAHGREAAAREARDFGVHDGAIEFGKAQAAIGRRLLRLGAELGAQLGSKFVARRDQDFMLEAHIVRQDVIAVRAVAEEADDGRMLARDDLHDAAFGASIGAAADDAAEDAVAVHRVAEAIAADEEIAVDAGDRMIRDEEGVAVAMRDDAAGDEIGIAGAARGCGGRLRVGRSCLL